ncbi:MAG: beta-ketoacyl-[acyl-carrier-protein] synthase family protein [Gammaproteobacteria bacterium]|nr:beta-ketoacyl-[acyl-carrier-protein] synthase family protein [Gammaproteobacteria bacterium]MBU2058624.1 beta-ketoacyl-[acyl-carrier-protein] synthase family protein [Gammaproteobacteria bacterium]MBU2173576.1 beta-ketoacyl-[acyl-carrier-protein] synthase family protein [Gammaproteobacteria bacterium]MBU2246530.1 beta-ketoacyl-[acyl-carrier-protein] synthase family protein [Gammaproteobacteria bacterium]MBU2343203.1 beta-ketoacyl-[acyl-carrier-protein] synthase family protein [Gammaproteobac
MKQKVVITGLGVVSPYGVGVPPFWSAVKKGQGAISNWQPEGVSNYPVRYAAAIAIEPLQQQFPGYFPADYSVERRSVFGLIAAENAIADAGLTRQNAARWGVSVCSGVPEADDQTLAALVSVNSPQAALVLLQQRHQLVNKMGGFRCGNDLLATAIASQYELEGPVLNISGACAGATQAIGLAYKAIQRGEADLMLAGGGDSVLNIRTNSALVSLGACSTSQRFGNNLCRPFDQDRSGLVAGEGAAMLVLESEQHAKARGATIYAELVGYGSSLDAYKVTAPHPEGTGAVAAMQAAIADAGLEPYQIGHINAHGTSTPLNDVVESKAIEQVFGAATSDLWISATKSVIGHWIAAAGAPEAIATILALKEKCVPPTINLCNADPDCRLRYARTLTENFPHQFALSNSFGFGGINASLIFGVYP